MKFNQKYGEPMLKNLIATRGWCRLKYRPVKYEYFGEVDEGTPEYEWIMEQCVKDVQYCDGYLYFQEPKEATAFALVWTK